ncbi:histidine phosphatase family protein [Gordonia hydrophobica]|uniref:histidine phosphatase family protein n=1 Tax=Gordonia hydrophobica TaxID=40516 RepID=UPI0027DC5F7C|nr:histidine phosphatase family protein [Gordonia hydrophobica]MBM7366678.1 broad specificity phosphatase PhoE [Gordonia hydrophobica]
MVAARTAPNRTVRFGGEHDPLDERGLRDATALGATVDGPLISGPELSVVQTARAVTTDVSVNHELCSLDVGRWRGVTPQDLPAAQVGAWLADPDWIGHGGESVASFVERIRRATESLNPMNLVVAKPVAQALLCVDAAGFFAVDVRPATVYDVGL